MDTQVTNGSSRAKKGSPLRSEATYFIHMVWQLPGAYVITEVSNLQYSTKAVALSALLSWRFSAFISRPKSASALAAFQFWF
jgi:hypothetical protein